MGLGHGRVAAGELQQCPLASPGDAMRTGPAQKPGAQVCQVPRSGGVEPTALSVDTNGGKRPHGLLPSRLPEGKSSVDKRLWSTSFVPDYSVLVNSESDVVSRNQGCL